MKGQLAVHFELIGGCHTFTCVEEHVRELKTQTQRRFVISKSAHLKAFKS